MPGAGEDDTIKHQQNLDLGKPDNDDAPPKIDGSVKGPIERLDKSVDADGFLHDVDEGGLPADTEEARQEDILRSRREGQPRR